MTSRTERAAFWRVLGAYVMAGVIHGLAVWVIAWANDAALSLKWAVGASVAAAVLLLILHHMEDRKRLRDLRSREKKAQVIPINRARRK